MKQQVIVTRLADRHRGPERAFSESYEVIVEAGELPDVLEQVAKHFGPWFPDVALREVWRWTITIGEPYDA